ncbi:MAG: DUF1553 domain-containing protein [Candidatus Omnitrophica bacterium]|nr:DUF1553 domain-containing protein [Candidatus Omnitrophota bacterium]
MTVKKFACLATAALCLSVRLCGAGQIVSPFESAEWSVPESVLDKHVLAGLRAKGIEPAPSCSDEVFLRRAYLDIIGMVPEPEDVKEFLKDTSPDKRSALIDFLLESNEFAEYWSLKWGDILRVKAEFPINLWPNAVQAYHRWILSSLKENKPYDIFVRQMLTSSGSNFREPQVNFYRALQGRGPSSIAGAVALTFMGMRPENAPEQTVSGMSAFFSRVAYKSTKEWKEEIVYCKPAEGTIEAVFPDGTKVSIPADRDPRIVFADWLITPDNPWFAKNIVNRIWSWLMGRGIIHEPDDIRKDNPASNPQLLAYLEKELVSSNYNLRHIYRLILNSRTYQQSSIPRSTDPDAERLFAYYPVRRLDAEVLLDMLCRIGGGGEEYVSPIPEPFTVTPRYQRNVLLSDGSITGPFLELFGRPSRDTGKESERNNNITDAQQRYLINSSDIQRRIQSSEKLRKIILLALRNSPKEAIDNIYLFMLSRYPTAEEIAAAGEYFSIEGIQKTEAVQDFVWALINNKEFIYRH